MHIFNYETFFSALLYVLKTAKNKEIKLDAICRLLRGTKIK